MFEHVAIGTHRNRLKYRPRRRNKVTYVASVVSQKYFALFGRRPLHDLHFFNSFLGHNTSVNRGIAYLRYLFAKAVEREIVT